MNYPYSVPPFLQNAMAQAYQAIMSGGPLPPNCFVMTIPIQQAQSMFPPMPHYGPGTGAFMFNPQPSYYGQPYQPQIAPYQYNPPLPPPPSNTLVPYTNYYSSGYNQNYNHPIVPYDYGNNQNGSKKKHYSGAPHSNVYNSSSFDSDMENLSWSRLFGNHHQRRRQSKQRYSDQQALNYNGKKKQQNESSDTFTSTSESGSTSTTSDETIRRVTTTTNNQPSTTTGATATTTKQQTKGSLPFKYSSEFIPGTAKQQQQTSSKNQKPPKSSRKEAKVRSDDIFVIKKN